MAEGIHFPGLPLADDPQQQESNTSIEQALQMISERFAQITELTEENLAELLEGLTEETSPEDTDRVVVGNNDGTVSYVEFGDLGGGGGGLTIPPESGRWIIANAVNAQATTNFSAGADRAYFMPFSVTRSLTDAEVGVVAGSLIITGDLAVAVYDSDASTGLPNNRLAQDINGSNLAIGNALTTTVDLEAGVTYWLGVGLDTNDSLLGLVDTNVRPLGDSAASSAEDDGHFYISLAGAWTELPDPFSGARTYGLDAPAVFIGV